MYGEYDTLYSFDEYKGYKIFISEDNCKYYAHVYLNGTCLYEGSSIFPDKLLNAMKDQIDGDVEDSALDEYYGVDQ